MGLFSKVFSKMHSPKTNSDANFEEQVRKDGVEHASSRIAELVNEKIYSHEVALQFVLEELDAARNGNDIAVAFALNSGFSPYEYIGALEKTTWEGEESELEHVQLFLRHFGAKISDIDLRVELGTNVVDKIMQKWKLGKYASQQASLKAGMRLEEAEVDIISIVRNNNVIYINDEADHLFIPDKDGDEKLDGRVVNLVFSGQSDSEVVEIFVAFDDSDSYTMFTLQAGMIERLNYVAQAIFKYFSEANFILKVFSPIESYSTQYIYTFKLYRKNNKYFMVNNAQTQAYLIDEFCIRRDDVKEIKETFWGDPNIEIIKDAHNTSDNNEPQKEELGEEAIEKQNEIIAQLSSLSESNAVKTCTMTIQPIHEIWSWEFEFSDGELETANELVSILYVLRNGDFIAPVYNIAKQKDSSHGFEDDVPF